MKQGRSVTLTGASDSSQVVKIGILTMLSFMIAFNPLPDPAHGKEVVDRIVAVVNDDIIMLSELEKAIIPYKEQIISRDLEEKEAAGLLFNVRQKMLDKLIGEKLTDQEIERLKLSVSEKEIDEAIEQIKKANYLTDESLREALKTDGLTMIDYRKEIKAQILRPRLINYEVKSKVIVTDEDIEAYYRSHPERYGGATMQYHLRAIMMSVEDSAGPDVKERKRKAIEAVHQRLEKGESFTAIAGEVSDSVLSADGGKLGAFKLEDLSPLYQQSLKGIKEGGHTGILETPSGYQILYVEKIAEEPGKSLKEVSEEISGKLYEETVSEKFNTWLEGLRKKSDIRIIN